DMTQKYGLRIKGGVGEIRAAMSLVNGWQFTGLGPYYMKDSSTAQNVLATGITANLTARGVADILKSLADLRSGRGRVQAADVTEALTRLKDLQVNEQFVPLPPGSLCRYAEIQIYEPSINAEGQMVWNRIVDEHFDREYLGAFQRCVTPLPPKTTGDAGKGQAQEQAAVIDAQTRKLVIDRMFGGPPA